MPPFVHMGRPIRKKSKNYNGKMDSMDQLFQEKFKLENVENIEEIILSDEWLSFFESLINNGNSGVFSVLNAA